MITMGQLATTGQNNGSQEPGYLERCEAVLHDKLSQAGNMLFGKALRGDVKAAQKLLRLTILDDAYLDVVGCLLSGVPPVFREVFWHAWYFAPRSLFATFGESGMRRLLWAAGTRPTDLPERLTLWRGGRTSLATLGAGWSWSTDFALAAHYALDFHKPEEGPPLVIRGEVRAARVVHADLVRKHVFGGDYTLWEPKFLVFGIRDAVVDGTPAAWAEAVRLRKAARGAEFWAKTPAFQHGASAAGAVPTWV